MIEWILKWLFRGKIEELRRIENALDEKVNSISTVYTTVKSYKGLNVEYYSWVSELLTKDQYMFFVFDLRENLIREMSGMTEEREVIRQLGRLDMLNVIDNYLKQYKRGYEDSIRRNSENTEK